MPLEALAMARMVAKPLACLKLPCHCAMTGTRYQCMWEGLRLGHGATIKRRTISVDC